MPRTLLALALCPLVSCSDGALPLSEWEGGGLDCVAFEEPEGVVPRLACQLLLPDEPTVDDTREGSLCFFANALTVSASRGAVTSSPGGKATRTTTTIPTAPVEVPFCAKPSFEVTELDTEVTLSDGKTSATIVIARAPSVPLKADKTTASVALQETIELRRVDDGAFVVPILKDSTWQFGGGAEVSDTVVPIIPTSDAPRGLQTVRLQHRLSLPAPESSFFMRKNVEWWVVSKLDVTVLP